MGGRRGRIALAAGLAVALAVLFLLRERGEQAREPERTAPEAQAPVPEVRPDARPSAARPPAAEPEAPRIASGETLSLEPATLPSEGPVALTLELPPEATAVALRVLTFDGERASAIEAVLREGEPGGARVEIDSALLSPGSYLIELTTDEKRHFPLRRYMLVIR